MKNSQLCGACYACAKFFARHIAQIGYAVDGGARISYVVDRDTDLPVEGYRLVISAVADNAASIVAKDEGGLLYAFVTLTELIHNYDGEPPECEIIDYPSLKYRGLLVDVSRYFFSVDDIYRFADFCALHKLNVMHLHLTDDQGWRVEISKYPLLTEIGSRRTHTNFGCKPHGGYYTKDDIKNIIGYCNALNIEVIPEIDMPGHVRSALAAYPELGCFGRKLPVATHSGVKHDILCAGKENVYDFVTDVLDEIIELFGGNTKYIHLGGDEVNKHRWEHCPDCQRRIAEEGLDGAEGLQGYFMERVGGYIIAKGYVPIMWNECSAVAIGEQSVCEYWGNIDLVGIDDIAKAAERFGKVINTTGAHCYVDLPYSYISLRKAYDFTPVPVGISAESVAGAEISLWTEYVPDMKTAMRRLIPRAEALAEAMWSRGEKNYEEFTARLSSKTAFLAKSGFSGISAKRANPGKLRSLTETIWFERRQLHWEGLHNLIDDARVARRHKKQK